MKSKKILPILLASASLVPYASGLGESEFKEVKSIKTTMLDNSTTAQKTGIGMNPWVERGLVGLGSVAFGATVAAIGVNYMKNKEIDTEKSLKTAAETAKTSAENVKNQLQNTNSALTTENSDLKQKLKEIHDALKIAENGDPIAKIQSLNSKVNGDMFGLKIFAALKEVHGKDNDELTPETLAKELDDSIDACNEFFDDIVNTQPKLENSDGNETNLLTSLKTYGDFSKLNFNDDKTKKNIFYTMRSLLSTLELIGCGRHRKSDSDESIFKKENYNQANNYNQPDAETKLKPYVLVDHKKKEMAILLVKGDDKG